MLTRPTVGAIVRCEFLGQRRLGQVQSEQSSADGSVLLRVAFGEPGAFRFVDLSQVELAAADEVARFSRHAS